MILDLIDLDWTLFQKEEQMVTLFSACHLLGMSSTCTSPILYAFVNKNFRAG